MNYVYADFLTAPDAVQLGAVQGLENDHDLMLGLSVADRINDDVHFTIDSRHAAANRYIDVLENMEGLLIVSKRVKEFLEPLAIKNNEIWPAQIRSNDNSVVDEEYFVIHQIHPQDCIDMEKSVYTMSELKHEGIADIEEISLIESSIDPDVALFRMKNFSDIAVFRRDLAEQFQAQGFEGLQFTEFEDWDY